MVYIYIEIISKTIAMHSIRFTHFKYTEKSPPSFIYTG